MEIGRYVPRSDDYTIRAYPMTELQMEAKEDILPDGRRYVLLAKPWKRRRVEWID